MHYFITRLLLYCFVLMLITLTTHQTTHAQGIAPVGQTGGEITAIAKEGSYVFIGQSDQFIVLNVANPTTPAVMKKISMPSNIQDITLVDGIAYVTLGFGGIEVLDVHTPLFTQSLSRYTPDAPFFAGRLAVVNQTLYVTTDQGLKIFNIGDATQLQEMGDANFDTNYSYIDIQVQNQIAYIANQEMGLMLVDVSDPANPLIRATYDTPGYAIGIDVVDGLAYVADSYEGLHIIDVTNVDAPLRVGTLVTEQFASDVHVEDGVAYVAGGFTGVQTINVENPASLSVLGTYETRGQASRLVVADDIAYVADGSSGLQMIDVSTPAALTLVGAYSAVGSPWGLDVAGSVAYMANFDSGVYMVDVQKPDSPRLISDLDTPVQAHDVEKVEDYLYVADNFQMQIIDVSDISAPQSVAAYGGSAMSIQVEQNSAYILSGSEGMHIVDVSVPTAPTLQGVFNTNPANAEEDTDFFNYAKIVEDRAYVVANRYGSGGTQPSGTVHIVDITDPDAPTSISAIQTSQMTVQVDVSNDYLYIAARDLHIYDISNEISPTLVLTYTDGTYSFARSILVEDDLALVGGFGVVLLDVSDPAHPVQMAANRDCGDVKEMQLIDQTIYMACRYDGFRIAELRPEYFWGEATIAPDGGSFQSYDNSVNITLPPDAVTETVTLHYSSFDASTISEFEGKAAVRAFGVYAVENSSGERINQTIEPFTVELTYTGKQIEASAVDEDTLEIVYWNGDAWQLLPSCAGCSIDTSKNQVTIVTDQLNYFAVIGDSQSTYVPVILEHSSK